MSQYSFDSKKKVVREYLNGKGGWDNPTHSWICVIEKYLVLVLDTTAATAPESSRVSSQQNQF